MGQKVHPIGIRLGNTRRANSCWYKAKQYYHYFIQEDRRIREFIFRISSSTDVSSKGISTKPSLKSEPSIISEILIDRRHNTLQIRILGSRLGFFTNRKNLEDLRTKLVEKILICRKDLYPVGPEVLDPHEPVDVQIFIREMKCPEISALYQASLIVEELQKRTPFRRAIRLRTAQASQIREIQGVRIQISGRLGGAEIARTQWTREGQVPLHTICAHLDYSSRTAATIYGSLGVKVWIFTKK